MPTDIVPDACNGDIVKELPAWAEHHIHIQGSENAKCRMHDHASRRPGNSARKVAATLLKHPGAMDGCPDISQRQIKANKHPILDKLCP